MYTICFQSSKCSQHDTLQPLRPGLISKSNWDRCRKITAPQAMKFPGCLTISYGSSSSSKLGVNGDTCRSVNGHKGVEVVATAVGWRTSVGEEKVQAVIGAFALTSIMWEH
jgi:hypothetical protein